MKHFNKAVRNSDIYIIYRFDANVKRQQCHVTLEKTLTLPEYEDVILNSMSQTKE